MRDKKTILYLVSTLKRGGPIIQLGYIVKCLDREIFNPIILTLSPESNDSLQSYFADRLRVKVCSLQLSRLVGVFLGERRLKNFINTHQIDLLHSHGIRADILMSKCKAIKQVSTLHNDPFFDYPSKYGKFLGHLMAKQHLRVVRKHPHKMVACSKSIADEYQHSHRLNIRYIQNGVDTEQFSPVKQTIKLRLRKALNLPIDKIIYIATGHLIARKDMATVIKGFTHFSSKNANDAVLIIAGDGKEKEALRQLVNGLALEKVIFLGRIKNVAEYLQASDCFISASLSEGLPNGVLEAMACGLPTILSNIPAHLELYESTRGLFFHPKDFKKLSQLLADSHDHSLKHSQIALEQINNRFNAEIMSKKYQKLYLKCLH